MPQINVPGESLVTRIPTVEFLMVFWLITELLMVRRLIAMAFVLKLNAFCVIKLFDNVPVTLMIDDVDGNKLPSENVLIVKLLFEAPACNTTG